MPVVVGRLVTVINRASPNPPITQVLRDLQPFGNREDNEKRAQIHTTVGTKIV